MISVLNLYFIFTFQIFLVTKTIFLLVQYLHDSGDLLRHSKNSINVKTIFLRDFRASRNNPLDNCQFVFLDMGSNFGVQIR